LSAFEGPYVAAEDSAEVSKAMDVGIAENLQTIVVHEAVGERVNVGQSRQQNQYEEHDGIAIFFGCRAQPRRGHKIMLADGGGGI